MNSSHKLRIDWCSYDAAMYAVQHWHYSRSLPCSKTARLGVWENEKFIGAVVFAWGANRHLAGEYKLKMTASADVTRSGGFRPDYLSFACRECCPPIWVRGYFTARADCSNVMMLHGTDCLL